MLRPILTAMALGAGLFLAACAQPAAEPALIPRAELFGNPERNQARISPDGTQISWLAPRDGVMNIYVAPANNLEAAQPVTQETGRPIRFHNWSADSRYVLYTQDTNGDENFLLYAVDPRTGESRSFAPSRTPARTNIVATSSRRPNIVLVSVNDRDPQAYDIYAIDLTTGTRTSVYRNVEGFQNFAFDNDLNVRVAYEDAPGGGGRYMRRDGNRWVELQRIAAEDGMTTNAIGLNAAGDSVYMLSSVGRERAALISVNLATGQSTVIGENDRADVGMVMIHPTTFEVLAYSANYLRNEWIGVDQSVGADLAYLREQLNGDINILSQTSDNQTWIVAVNSATASPSMHRFDRNGRTLTKLFDQRPALADDTLAEMHPVEIPARDGLTLVSYLTLPPNADANNDGRADRPVPLVLNVHGGPWGRDVYGFNAQSQWFANRGYATLQVNFRASTGFGKTFVNAGDLEWAGAMHNDLLDAINWAVAQGVTTADKVAIFGGSYGGYATLVGLTFTPDTFACGVDLVGPSNLVTLIESFPPYWAPQLEGQWYPRMGDPRTPEGREAMMARSPITRVADIRRPLLIAQGANDPRVNKGESDQIVAAMQERSIPVTYLLYPDEGHGFARPQNNTSYHAVSEAFLSQCLGGRYEPIGNDLQGSSMQIVTGAEHVPGLADAQTTPAAN